MIVRAERLDPRYVLDKLHLIRIRRSRTRTRAAVRSGIRRQTTRLAHQRIRLLFSLLNKRRTNIPASGQKATMLRICCRKKSMSPRNPINRGIRPECESLRVSPQDVTDKDQNAQNHHQRVILRISGLNQADRPTERLDEIRRQTGPARRQSSDPTSRIRSRSSSYSTPSHSQRRRRPFASNFHRPFPGILGAIHEQSIVKFIDVVLVRESGIRPAVLPNVAMPFPIALFVIGRNTPYRNRSARRATETAAIPISTPAP